MTEPSVPAEHAATRRAMLGCAGAAAPNLMVFSTMPSRRSRSASGGNAR